MPALFLDVRSEDKNETDRDQDDGYEPKSDDGGIQGPLVGKVPNEVPVGFESNAIGVDKVGWGK